MSHEATGSHMLSRVPSKDSGRDGYVCGTLELRFLNHDNRLKSHQVADGVGIPLSGNKRRKPDSAIFQKNKAFRDPLGLQHRGQRSGSPALSIGSQALIEIRTWTRRKRVRNQTTDIRKQGWIDGRIFFLSTMKLFLSSDPETAKRLWTETSETMIQDRTLS